MSEFKVVTDGAPNELWASGFYDDAGREKAQRMVADGSFHQFVFARDKHKKLIVVPVRS